MASPTNAPGNAGAFKQVAPMAMTTQFTPPADIDCAVWTLTTDDMGTGDDFLYSNTADERFTACQPSGWVDRPDALRFSFSPAVCPSGWSWHRMAIAPNNISTTALCCADGFTLHPHYNVKLGRTVESCTLMRNYGYAATTAVVTLASGSVSTATNAYFVHEAWNIAWRGRDRDMLTPEPPVLTGCSTYIHSWDGKATSFCGGNVPPHNAGTYDTYALGQLGIFLITFLTLLGVTVLACIGFCVWLCRRSRKKRRQATQATQPTQPTQPTTE